ncbi:hypothetical protein RUM43_012825 [Polyplax serrata]|uniref:Uncharacterized protein n=1 Tax=Polyplax serrata TaxID=468196 RepID=A0AAN8P1B0_POLSC
MSYLPRMSKTYKEPQAMQILDEVEEIKASIGIQPASSLANDKTYNPQIALKHYKYHPHPLPVLPGPSVMDEINENELHREASKLKRSQSKISELSKVESTISNEPDQQVVDSSLAPLADTKEPENDQLEEEHLKRPSSKRNSVTKTSKVSISRKKSSRFNIDKKREAASKQTVNICLVQTDVPDSLIAPQKDQQLKNSNQPETSSFKGETTVAHCSNPFRFGRQLGSKDSVHRSVQCTIYGSSDKTYVIPQNINVLLKTLALLLHEVNKDDQMSSVSQEGKRIMTQVQLILADLCNQTADRDFGFDVTYSDSKRVEKLLNDLEKYITGIYGPKSQFTSRDESLKKVYLQLKMKELELGIIQDQIMERDSLRLTEIDLKGSDMKNPEVTLQNKRLESEQLLAEIEFSGIELKKYQKALAEADWDIKLGHEQMTTMRRSTGSKSRTDMLGRRPSSHKFGFDGSAKGGRGKELEEMRARKKA